MGFYAFEAAQDGFDFATALLSGVTFCDEDPNSDVFVYRIGLHHGPVIELKGMFSDRPSISPRGWKVFPNRDLSAPLSIARAKCQRSSNRPDAQGLQRL